MRLSPKVLQFVRCARYCSLKAGPKVPRACRDEVVDIADLPFAFTDVPCHIPLDFGTADFMNATNDGPPNRIRLLAHDRIKNVAREGHQSSSASILSPNTIPSGNFLMRVSTWAPVASAMVTVTFLARVAGLICQVSS